MRTWVFVALLAGSIAAGASGSSADQDAALNFKRSRVEELNASGKLQLVEFYHPT